MQIILQVYLTLALSNVPANARVIQVPGHYPTIQAAIDASDHGDTILIAPGTWSGPGNRDLDPAGKAIVIRSVNGPDSCVIDCSEQGRGFHLHSCESNHTVIQGLTIRGGVAGTSTFQLFAEDVTPVPFNQPPCPPAGHRTEQRIMVIGAVPPR